MSAQVLHILEKLKAHEFVNAEMGNFAVAEGESIPTAQVINHPHVSLYCVDDARQSAIFVETPPDVDLEAAPFYYAAQYNHALRLFAVPYEEFHQAACDIKMGRVIYVHSVGRCGSTVISKAFGAVDGVRSLSEPDIFTQLHIMRYLDKTRDAEFTHLLTSAIRFFSKDSQILVLKFRAMCIQIGDLLHNIHPEAHNLFLYRNAETWTFSMGVDSIDPQERRAPSTEVPLFRRSMAPLSVEFARKHGREGSRVEFAAMSWLSLMERFLELRAQGIPFFAVRYEDIRDQPKQVLQEVFNYCGLTTADIDATYQVFATDAQEGTGFSRASMQARPRVPFDEADYAQFYAVFRDRPVIQSPDFRVAAYDAN